MKFLNLLKKLEKGGFHLGLLVVGIGFLVFTVLPLISDKWTSDSPWWMNLIFAAVGIGSIFFAVRGLKNVATTSLDENNDFNKVDTASVAPEVIEKIRANNDPQKEYYFHYCGKLNQSYILETPDRKPVFEFNCDKIALVGDYVFTFVNHVAGKQDTHNISHTLTTSYGSDSFSIVDKSYFNIDGKNIWDYIGEMGYSVDPYLDPVVFSFKVRHYGVEVADLKAAGTNVLPQYEGKEGLRDVAMGGGLYKVSCREEDAEAVAMVAFAVSRVQIV